MINIYNERFKTQDFALHNVLTVVSVRSFIYYMVFSIPTPNCFSLFGALMDWMMEMDGRSTGRHLHFNDSHSFALAFIGK